MHIAICDDNVADRKQLERLLMRESDKRKYDTGVFYLSSFGNSDILGKSPMQYDLFFLDMISEESNGLTFALELIQMGVTAPIVLCSSSIDYMALTAQIENPPANITHIGKPIKVAELAAVLDAAIVLQSQAPPTIELRNDKETYYVSEDDIVCGMANDRFVTITLADSREIQILDHLQNFYSQIAHFSHFSMVSQKAFINLAFIASMSLFKITLKNNKVFKVTFENRVYIKKIIKLLNN